MPRFFISEPPVSPYLLTGEPGRHAAKSLRLRPGEALTLCDGRGLDYPATVLEATPDGLLLDVSAPYPTRSEPAASVTVCQCFPKGDKLESVVQKSVELGAAAVWPIESAHCVARWPRDSVERKRARLQKIAQEAAMQSGRGVIPPVLPPAPLKAALETAAQEGEALFLYEKGTSSFKTALQSAGQRLYLFVGPEGGFAPEEADLARAVGARILSLGPRILRTETAPVAALSAIFYEKGDWELGDRD